MIPNTIRWMLIGLVSASRQPWAPDLLHWCQTGWPGRSSKWEGLPSPEVCWISNATLLWHLSDLHCCVGLQRPHQSPQRSLILLRTLLQELQLCRQEACGQLQWVPLLWCQCDLKERFVSVSFVIKAPWYLQSENKWNLFRSGRHVRRRARHRCWTGRWRSRGNGWRGRFPGWRRWDSRKQTVTHVPLILDYHYSTFQCSAQCNGEKEKRFYQGQLQGVTGAVLN